MDATHSPDLKSWIQSANVGGCDFPIQNLPFGVFRRKASRESPRGGVAIGDQILDVMALGLGTGPTLDSIAAMARVAQPATLRRCSGGCPGRPCRVRRYYYDANDRLLEMSDSLHAAENFAYEMRLKRD